MLLHLKSKKKVLINARAPMISSFVHLVVEGITQNNRHIQVYGQYLQELEDGSFKQILPGFNFIVENDQVNLLAETCSVNMPENLSELERRYHQLKFGTLQILDSVKDYGLQQDEWEVIPVN
jgi:hypothetical protein